MEPCFEILQCKPVRIFLRCTFCYSFLYHAATIRRCLPCKTPPERKEMPAARLRQGVKIGAVTKFCREESQVRKLAY